MIKDELPYISVCRNGLVITLSKIKHMKNTLRLRIRREYQKPDSSFMAVDYKDTAWNSRMIIK